MKRGTQKQIAEMVGISGSFVSQILSGKRRPSWPMAKAIANATNTTPELWLDGEPGSIREAIGAFRDESN
jgi:transcriptional regulator with XRE-family HTH domain